MFHSKSKSSKLQEKVEKQANKTEKNDSNQYNQNNSININNMDATKENLNVKLIINEDKISNLLSDSNNNEKIINISKLDEDLDYDDKKNKNSKSSKIKKLENRYLEGFMPGANDNEKPIINISNLEYPMNINDNFQEINNYINDTNKSSNVISDINKINNNKNDNNIKIVKKIETQNFEIKNKNNCFSKIPIYCRIILFSILIAIVMMMIIFIVSKNQK